MLCGDRRDTGSGNGATEHASRPTSWGRDCRKPIYQSAVDSGGILPTSSGILSRMILDENSTDYRGVAFAREFAGLRFAGIEPRD